MTTGDEWMCQACKRNPVPALGETLCRECAAQQTDESSRATDHARAVERARAFLEASDKATAFKVKDPPLAIALALQGILVCHIEAAEAAVSDPTVMLPAGIMLPEPEPEMGPKTWGP